MTFQRIAAVACALSISACADRPFTELSAASSQQKLSSAHHWEVLAERTADQLISGTWVRRGGQAYGHILTTPGKLAGRHRFYVQPLDSGMPFSRVFRELLISKLIEKGETVSATPQQAVVVNYRVQVVTLHRDRIRRAFPGPFTATAAMVGLGYLAATTSSTLGAAAAIGGWALVADARYALSDDPEAEVIVTVSVLDRKSFLMRKSSVFYIDGEDIWNYVTAFPPPALMPTRDTLETIEPWEAYTLAVRELHVVNR